MSCAGLNLVFSKDSPPEGMKSPSAASLPSRIGKILETQGLLAQRHWGSLTQPGAHCRAAWAGWDPKMVLALHPHSKPELGESQHGDFHEKQGNGEFSPKSFVDLEGFFPHI